MENQGRLQKPDNKPKIFISNKLVEMNKEGEMVNFLVKELENLRWEEVKTDMGIEQKPIWGRQANHGIDALSYVLATIYKPQDDDKQDKLYNQNINNHVENEHK